MDKNIFFKNLLEYMSDVKSDDVHFNSFYDEYYLQHNSYITNEPKNKKTMSLYDEINQCYKCHLGKFRKKAVNFGYGNNHLKNPYVLLLDIPSMADNIQGNFYSDNPISNMYKNILKAMGLNHEEVYTTSSIKCYSAVELPNDLSLISICCEYLKREMESISPELIIAMGEISYKLLMKDGDFQNNRGKKLNWMGYDVVFTEHPRKAVLNDNHKRLIWNDLKSYGKV